MTAPYQNTVHYSELTDLPVGDPLAEELATYKSEARRLIAEGHEGRFVLIKNGTIVGIWKLPSRKRVWATSSAWGPV